jgi:hypothetical protein
LIKIFSEGKRYASVETLLNSAISNVSILTLPINMVRVRTNLLAELKSAVIPLLSPTVAYADMHSKEIFKSPLSESKNEISRIDIEITKIESRMIA